MRLLALLIMAVLLSGCNVGGDGGDHSVEPDEFGKLVLQPGDLAQAFLRFDEGRQGIADAPQGPRADAMRFGRQAGWKARYRRSGTTTTKGPLVIVSLADVFGSTEGAKDDLKAMRQELEDGELPWRNVDVPDIGDESLAATVEQGGVPRVAYFRVAWRRDNVTASLEVNGFRGKVVLAEAVELARKQDKRIDQAAG